MDSFGLDEQRRHDTLAAYGVEDAGRSPALHQLIRIAALACGAPMAAVTLAEGMRFRTLISFGFGPESGAPAELSSRTVCSASALIVPDTTQCSLVDGSPPATDEGKIRSYVGMPLISSCGVAYGALEVMDFAPREACTAQLEVLEFLAARITAELENRRKQAAQQPGAESTARTWPAGAGSAPRACAIAASDPAIIGDEIEKIITGWSPDARSTEQKSQEQLLLLQTCVERLNDIVVITDAEPLDHPGPRIVFVNDAFQRRTGYRREEVIGKTPRILQGPKTQVLELARIGDALRRRKPVRAELINYTKSGEEFWLELDIVPVANATGKLIHWVAVHRDITARKAAEAKIQHLAFYDSLTGLPNRRHLLNRLEQALASSHRSELRGALLFIDLDGFKTLNDTLGHDMGDQLLQQVASRLSACLRQSDTLARLGGDEFVVILENLGHAIEEAASKAGAVCDKILATINQPFQLGEHEYGSSPSIGVTLFGDQPLSITELLKRADMAMYQSKSAGRNTVRFFDPQMQAAVTARSALEGDLRHALQRQEFLVHYQPQVNGDRQITGVEALVRWQHPRCGMMAPDEFITVAEETGLIVSLGLWVLSTACTQLASWAARPETALLNMAVNVSARQFRHPDFVSQVLAVLDSTGANPRLLKLELTESLLIDDMEVTSAKMRQLKTKGVSFSLDDFGTGYASLSYLKRLPLDQLKLDRLFVRDVLTDPNDASIATTIVKLARSLGLSVIAEGVETAAQRDFLAHHDCTAYQGYLFSRPLSIEKLEELIQQANVGAIPGVEREKLEEP